MVLMMPSWCTERELPRLQITNLRSTDLSHFVNACFSWIITMKWSYVLLQKPDDESDKLLKWSGAPADLTLLYDGLERNKGKLQDSIWLHGENKETHYEQSVSWSNETSLLSKSEFIHDYVHGSLLIYSLLWETFPMQSLILHNRILWMSMISCMVGQNMSVPSDNLWHAMSLSHPSIMVGSP